MTEVRVVAEVPADVDVIGEWAHAGEPPAGVHAATGFTGTLGESVVVGGAPARIVVGLGPRVDLPGPDASAALRRAGAALARAARWCRQVAVAPPVDDPRAVRAIVEGFLLATYRFDRYRSVPPRPAPNRLDVVADRCASSAPSAPSASMAPAGDPIAAAVWTARQVAAAVSLARDLGNEPGGRLTPSSFAERAAEVAARGGLGCEVWDEHRIAAEGLGGLLGVGRGSEQPPRLVRLDYRPAAAPDAAASDGAAALDAAAALDTATSQAAAYALVGKGVTFDAGGLSLKPTKQMVDMKIDMAGAAAVLGAMSALPSLGCPVRVVGWLPLVENMPGGGATRLGDVLRIRDGTTVEVRNADAEGRLILADALALAGEERPEVIIDVATLTAAVSLAVGRRYAGLVSNDDALLARIGAAARWAGEAVWPLPLTGGHGEPRGPDDLRDTAARQLRSTVADLVNVPGTSYGQSTVAALFLSRFVPPGIPWAHLDINGPAFSDEDDGELTAGATGYGVRTLLELLTG